MLVKPRSTSTAEGGPAHAVIAKIDRMKTRQGESLFLKVDVGGETVRVFGRPEELAERLEASGYDIPASEIEAGMELHLPCLVKVGQGHNGYKNIEAFLPEACLPRSGCRMTACHIHLTESEGRKPL